MSEARASLLNDVKALDVAVAPSTIGQGTGVAVNPGLGVLRRGAAITALVMLESFVRDRTEEILEELQHWPARYEDLPKRFRDRATIDALPHIEKFARMLQRRGEDYEKEIFTQVGRMVTMSPPALQFTKFIAGDYTGNLSAQSIKELLKIFGVRDCWNSMRTLSADVGFGVPSVEEVLKGIVMRRHRSAHVAGYTPAASDAMELPHTLRLIGICIDAALSAAIHVAVNDWRKWVADGFSWRDTLEIYFLVRHGSRFRLIKKGAKRATRIVDAAADAKLSLSGKVSGVTRLVVEQGADGRPTGWDVA